MKPIKNKLHLLPSALHNTHRADYWQPLNTDSKRVQCLLSPRNCKIPSGGLGFCGVRYNNNDAALDLFFSVNVNTKFFLIDKQSNHSIMHSCFEKQIVFRVRRLIHVLKLRFLRSIFCVFVFSISCLFLSTFRS